MSISEIDKNLHAIIKSMQVIIELGERERESQQWKQQPTVR